MARHITIKDHIRETWLFNKRVITALVFIAILLAIIISRLFYLQIVSHEHFTTLSHNNRVNIIAVPPTRGLIYDRHGRILAQNIPSFSLEIVPERIDDIDATLAEIGKLIEVSDEDIEQFNKLLKSKRRFESVPIRYRLTDEEVARFAVNRHRLPGVEIEARLSRHYPLGPLAVHAIGYVGRIDENDMKNIDRSNYSATTNIGKIGIEKSYEPLLHGEVGYQQAETNARGRILRVLDNTPATPGTNLHLHLDAKLQEVAEQAFGRQRGALVAIDTVTGGVLALVSMPTYDPNLFINGIDYKTYGKLRDSPDKPLFNRALRGQYPPGSTIKPFLGLAALEYQLGLGTDNVYCPGYYTLDNDPRKYRDWKKGGHGHVDLDKAITQSCDVYFYVLARQLTIDRIYAMLHKFGFGMRTNIDIEGELAGLLPSREWKKRVHGLPWFPGETLISGIGQGFNLSTPLQLANATAILARKGKKLQPRVVASIQNQQTGETASLEDKSPDPVQLHNQSYWQTIINSMINVAHTPHGTAYRIGHNAPYRLAGKTGTAQVFGIKQDEEYEEENVTKKLRDHALFVAFAPAEEPRIAVALIVENAGGGGANAAPIARKVMDQYLTGHTP